ncbi:MAG: hypothetical protein LBD23_14580 [Oscillospiraceae bacterium]|nr:hypothetical protein [Oscillospiraceae bacterium]
MIIRVGNKRDSRKLTQFSTENGWKSQSVNQLLSWLVNTAPKEVPLSYEDIMNEIREVRKERRYADVV